MMDILLKSLGDTGIHKHNSSEAFSKNVQNRPKFSYGNRQFFTSLVPMPSEILQTSKHFGHKAKIFTCIHGLHTERMETIHQFSGECCKAMVKEYLYMHFHTIHDMALSLHHPPRNKITFPHLQARGGG